MASITSAGIGSGLDVESLISKLVSVERAPIQQLQKRTDGLKTQLSAYGKLQSSLSALRDAASKLTRADTFGAVSTSSTNAAAVSASAVNGTAAGSYGVTVTRLAAAQSLASAAQPTGSSTGTGTITIDFGTYTTNNLGEVNFDADPARTSLVIPVISGDDQLDKVRDKINAMKLGIVASVVTDANGSRLVMRGVDPGAANAFRVTVADDDGNSTDGTGLSAFAYDRSTLSPVNTGSIKQTAVNAQATIEGVDIESASNTISSAIEGVSFTLSKTSADPITITVGQDKAAIKKAVTDFAAAYNDTLKLLRDQSRYDAATKTAGPLQGDSTVVSLINQMRNLAGSTSTLGGTLTRFAEIGLDPSSDGSLKVNDTKLDAAVAKATDLKALLSGEDAGNSANNGLALRLREMADALLSTDGRLTNRQKGLQDRISTNDKRETELERRVALAERRLRAQYTALDGSMSRMQGVSSYLNQQLSKL
ncbi:flagellar filament capping protein FliD [Inhella gelatinilytica]|uniref:Flagellar hook-associated protein 2 n=1 Tax=Inhella gelatinilytica TaxID=2795030 RepID=A0A931NAR2_9BURK|nr:flagellar filament capping protein FliD [Inhella gelatinilytica]MBH9552753.1 flagellar filament capping protein FliD [Inhella gelatinilytica]